MKEPQITSFKFHKLDFFFLSCSKVCVNVNLQFWLPLNVTAKKTIWISTTRRLSIWFTGSTMSCEMNVLYESIEISLKFSSILLTCNHIVLWVSFIYAKSTEYFQHFQQKCNSYFILSHLSDIGVICFVAHIKFYVDVFFT